MTTKPDCSETSATKRACFLSLVAEVSEKSGLVFISKSKTDFCLKRTAHQPILLVRPKFFEKILVLFCRNTELAIKEGDWLEFLMGWVPGTHYWPGTHPIRTPITLFVSKFCVPTEQPYFSTGISRIVHNFCLIPTDRKRTDQMWILVSNWRAWVRNYPLQRSSIA